MKQSVTLTDVGSLDLIKEDPYRTNEATNVHLYINPSNRSAGLETYSHGQGVSTDLWHGRHLTVEVHTCGGPVDGPDLVDWLRGDDGQTLLSRICDGHSIEWDGNNHVGRLTDDARGALDELERELSHVSALTEPAGLWDAESWFCGMCSDDIRNEYGITADTTDSELADIEAKIIDEAANENVVLVGTYRLLVRVRNDE